LLLVLTLVSSLGSIYFLWSKRNNVFIILFLFCLVGVLFCFSAGPHIRYAYGYLVVLLAINISYCLQYLVKIKPRNFTWLFILISVIPCLFTLYTYKVSGDKRVDSILIYPAPYTKNELVKTQLNGHGQRVFITKQNGSCWDCFPCSYYMIEGCEIRGKSFEEGFRVLPKK
jgi:hypothetical protein